MDEIIKVCYDDVDRPTVSGRELHDALGVKEKYSDWFKRMCEYDFTECVDYCSFLSNSSFSGKSEKPKGGRPSTDHQLTIPMAKELCMIQRTEKGKQMRQYFIAVEERWNSPDAVMARALRMADRELHKLEAHCAQLEQKAERDKPKVLFSDSVATSETSILVGELAKILKQNGVNTGQTRLFSWLRDHGYLIKRKGTDYNMPTQRAMEVGLFEVKQTCITHADGHVTVSKTPKVTGKGQIYFVNKIMAEATEAAPAEQ